MRLTTLIGREGALSEARAICARAEAGRGSVLIVIGEPGIGKTALLEAIGEMPGWRVV